MDAAVACILPELRADMAAIYAGHGQPLISRDVAAVARFDERLALFIAAANAVTSCAGLDAALRIVRVGEWEA